MPSQIAAVEDSIIAALRSVFQNRVPTIEWAPPDWDEDFIKRTLKQLPGAFVIFEGGTAVDGPSATTKIDAQWMIVAATRHVQDAKTRARGDQKEIGCYEMIEAAISKLDGMIVEHVGTLGLIEWNNEMALKLENIALMTQSASFHMVIEISRTLDPGLLSPFKIFHATYDVDQKPGAPSTEDHVELPQ